MEIFKKHPTRTWVKLADPPKKNLDTRTQLVSPKHDKLVCPIIMLCKWHTEKD
jgi:hypothetical protein